MFAKYINILISVLLFDNVLCQVCVDTKMSWRDVPETYLYTYMEAYEKTDCLFWCTDTRVATAVGTRTVRKLVPERVNVCCDGYIEEESYTGNSLHCKPVCSPSCFSGYCKSPGVCACNPGYLPDIFEHHICIPLCLKGCEHGICKAPNTCECDAGYEYVDEICEPICSDPCDNGTCVAPNTCQCLPGYKKSDYDICEPYCSSYTANGECINTITCEPGWVKVVKDALEICEPVCAKPCVNGACVAPEMCECHNGYEKSTLDTCEPYCSSGCLHGSCISPETCVCEPGWFIKESGGECLAHCDHPCGNGTCIAPNVCECFSGYGFDESKLMEEHGSPLCVPLCENCEGICVAPEECTCPWPEIPMHVTNDGIPCHCVNCSNAEDKCEKTICFTTTTTTSPDDVTFDTEAATTESVSSAYVTEENETTANRIDHYEGRINKASWFDDNAGWFYGIGSVLLGLMLIVIIAAVLKRKHSKSFGGFSNIYGSNGEEPSTVVHYKQTSMP